MLFVANGELGPAATTPARSAWSISSIVDSVAANWTSSQTVPGRTARTDTDFTRDADLPRTRATEIHDPDAGARVGNFATDIAVQDTRENGTLAPDHPDPRRSVDHVGRLGRHASCRATPSGKDFALCDDDAPPDVRRRTIRTSALLPHEPFNVYADSRGQFAVVTHLSTGDVTLIDSPTGGDATIADIAMALFQPDMTTGLLGSSGVAGRLAGRRNESSTSAARARIGSRRSPSAGRSNGQRRISSPATTSSSTRSAANAGTRRGHARHARSSSDGNRLYLINRDPPTLQIFDTSLADDRAIPSNSAIGVDRHLPRGGSTLQSSTPATAIASYVTCFEDGAGLRRRPERAVAR